MQLLKEHYKKDKHNALIWNLEISSKQQSIFIFKADHTQEEEIRY